MRSPGWLRFVVWDSRDETQELHDRFREWWGENRENLMFESEAWKCERCGDLAAFSVLDFYGTPDRERFEQDLAELRELLDATEHEAHQEPAGWAVTNPPKEEGSDRREG